MSIQNRLSLEVADLRDRAIELINEFESTNKLGAINYNQRLDRFLKRRIGKSADRILVAQILVSVFSLKTLNTNI